ncbi:hypothetical protein A3SI_11509 [Nitritalea halalkaliphila LW7]|uniref:Uncharacterized protein n=1 Tax=Nitritalea halalkaliphila LW7 TaxID=1189621 RepID=I5C2D9_9BACT|nr:hypothetical protein [Nitritalea halalkaliphila]EIM75991.1 hypothetical protein A3SI_11509 [Nitritalea halalkaliphila LW7]
MLKVIVPVLASLFMLGSLAFSFIRSQEQVLSNVVAEVEALPEIYFLDAAEVLATCAVCDAAGLWGDQGQGNRPASLGAASAGT